MCQMFVSAGLSPHPPIIIPEVGGRELQQADRTVTGMRAWAKEMALTNPETLVFISPHAPFLQGTLGWLAGQELVGSFADFGAPEVAFRVKSDRDLALSIASEAASEGLPVLEVNARSLDHGVMVPLYYLREAGVSADLVVFGISLLPPERHFRFGQALARAFARSPRRICLIASGDMSHRLLPGAPAGYDPQGQVFDRLILEALTDMDAKRIMDIPDLLADRAGECGLRPIIMLLGAVSDFDVESKIYSYEGPFGVGYLVAGFRLEERKTGSAARVTAKGAADGRVTAMPEQSADRSEKQPSACVRLARASLEHYLRTNRLLPVPDPAPAGMDSRAGAFVSLKKHGELRGCIGTIKPVRRSLAEEIINNAVSAGTEDPRFRPVQLDELPDLVISVDVLAPSEPIDSEDDLDPKRYGVIVSNRGRVGLLLPNLEGIDTVAEQVGIARQKAGLRPDEPVRLARFEVTRHE
jgi:AmmeMemoRadiSam system protein A